jgi:hypothetical protein
VNETSLGTLKKILLFAAFVEMGTGVALMVVPAIVVKVLLGVDLSGVGITLGRCFGVALLALGLACWPSRQLVESGSPAFRAMLLYNVLIASYLVYLGAVRDLVGLLLWPGAALHAIVAVALVWTWRGRWRSNTMSK